MLDCSNSNRFFVNWMKLLCIAMSRVEQKHSVDACPGNSFPVEDVRIGIGGSMCHGPETTIDGVEHACIF